MITYLDWDSNFFGFKIGYMDLTEKLHFNIKEIKNDIDKSGFKLIYIYSNISQEIKINSNDIDLNLVDTQLLLSMDIPDNIQGANYQIIDYKNKNDYKKIIEGIYNIAKDISVYSRFYNDKNISKSKIRDLYMKMVENSINNSYGNGVLFELLDDKIAGLFSIGIKGSGAKELLIGTEKGLRGKGIGRNIFLKALNFCKDSGVKKITTIVSARNIDSANFHFKLGYNLYNIRNVYHLWVN